ncbi:MAG: GDP-fucose synthetase [Candidatus Melainabacteria bacterium RIFCSPHIGHO2_02_FULL_34_12]|nr:MAG: GDP-fucose synthetase [Candidatus Melainabacteria bacterium RIFCSPHIGHO2_02_FULL_34_12]
MEKNSKIYVAGHTGLVGSAIIRELKSQGYINILTKPHNELDLLDTVAVANFFEKEKPEYIFLAAARVGGIYANSTFPAQFIYENLQIQINIIHNAYLQHVKKLLFLGSSCIYPRECLQPIKEEYLLTGKLEPTNEAYAIAKIAGIKMCQSYNKQFKTNYICTMPTNVYGIEDNFHPENSHVIPALIYRIHSAKKDNATHVTIWGTGKPFREFIYTDDLANACIFLMHNYSNNEIINIGTGDEISIAELTKIICEIVEYSGKIVFDPLKPDGTPRKLLDTSKLKKLGWTTKTNLKSGIANTYNWYLKNIS